MPGWLKLMLALFGAAAIGLCLVVAGATWWFRANKDKLGERARAAEAEGNDFGSTHSKGECIDDNLTRLKGCGAIDVLCETGVKLRLMSCMSVAKEDGTCGKIPARTEILKSVLWAREECSRRGQGGSDACQRLVAGIAATCLEARP